MKVNATALKVLSIHSGFPKNTTGKYSLIFKCLLFKWSFLFSNLEFKLMLNLLKIVLFSVVLFPL